MLTLDTVELTKKERTIQLITYIILSIINMILSISICQYFNIDNHILGYGLTSYSLTYEAIVWFGLTLIDIAIVYWLFGKKWLN